MTKIFVLFITFLLFAFYGDSWRCHAQGLVIPQVQVAPVYQVPAYQVYQPAPMIYVPQVQMIPYQYDRTEVYRREYRTPLRDALFGRYRAYNFYSPVQPQGVSQ